MSVEDMPGTMIRKGKVKEVYDLGDRLVFNFTNNISVFDKVIPTEVEHKGASLCRTSTYWFRELLPKLGIQTHFIGMPEQNRMTVKKVDVIEDYDKITSETKNYLIPLEVICRHYVAGSMHDRILKGKIKPEDVGFPVGHIPDYGEKFPEPLVEFTTKLEPIDRPVTKEEAMKMAALSETECQEIVETVLKIDDAIEKSALSHGLIHVDGKKEFAYNENRELMVIDTFGTADEDRFWDKEKHDAGFFVELSKEHVRQYYRGTGYHKELMQAREAGFPDPDIPPLPANVADEVSALYIGLYERLTGETF